MTAPVFRLLKPDEMKIDRKTLDKPGEYKPIYTRQPNMDCVDIVNEGTIAVQWSTQKQPHNNYRTLEGGGYVSLNTDVKQIWATPVSGASKPDVVTTTNYFSNERLNAIAETVYGRKVDELVQQEMDGLIRRQVAPGLAARIIDDYKARLARGGV